MANERFDGLLVVMTDVTAELERELAESETRELVTMFDRVARDRVGFFNFIEEASSLVRQLTADVPPPQAVEFRLVHTLKGSASVFGLSRIARTCHEIEERMREAGALSNRDRDLLEEMWQAKVARIQSLFGDQKGGNFVVARSEYDRLVELTRISSRADVLRTLADWGLDSVQARIGQLGQAAQALADRLGKPGLEVVCDGGGLRLDNAYWASFWSGCIHLVRNAVDHGIEEPLVRTTAGKRPFGRIVLHARCETDTFIIKIADDGDGIDWDRLAKRAREHKGEGSFAAGSQSAELLFMDGISSKSEVTEVSGRGIGMGALLDEIRSRHGTIDVTSERGVGTTFEMRFPMEAMLGPTAVPRAAA